MIETAQKVIYKAFGLSIKSEIPLPVLPRTSIIDNKVDVVIKHGDLSKLWSEMAEHPYSFVVKENFVMFQLPDIAIFNIKDGKEITVFPMKGSNEDQIRLYILGTCMGAILIQRKVYPLHGSAVEINGRAYAFIGESGAGKSTLASAFLSKGYHLLSDDVIPISLSTNKRLPLVVPSYPQQKLWQESLTEFGMESNNYYPIFQREDKYLIPVASKFYGELCPLSGVFEIVKTDQENVEITSTQGLDQLNTLFCHTYRNFLIPRLGLMEWHFATSTQITEKVNIFRLKRPTLGFSVHKMVDGILEIINGRNTLC